MSEIKRNHSNAKEVSKICSRCLKIVSRNWAVEQVNLSIPRDAIWRWGIIAVIIIQSDTDNFISHNPFYQNRSVGCDGAHWRWRDQTKVRVKKGRWENDYDGVLKFLMSYISCPEFSFWSASWPLISVFIPQYSPPHVILSWSTILQLQIVGKSWHRWRWHYQLTLRVPDTVPRCKQHQAAHRQDKPCMLGRCRQFVVSKDDRPQPRASFYYFLVAACLSTRTNTMDMWPWGWRCPARGRLDGGEGRGLLHWHVATEVEHEQRNLTPGGQGGVHLHAHLRGNIMGRPNSGYL